MANELHITEAKSQGELGATAISPVAARILSIGFLLLIALPGVGQLLLEFPQGKAFHEFHHLAGTTIRQKLRALERALDSESFLRTYVQRRLQTFLSSDARLGNETVLIASSGGLYYGPGLNYVVGQPFLDPDFLKFRAKQMVDKDGQADPNPDPRPALFDLIKDCQTWGITLVLVPIPDKAMLQPQEVTSRTPDQSSVPDNSSFQDLKTELRNQGADVFDWRPQFVRKDEIRYLKQDTHWTPVFMEEYASHLARYVESLGVLAPAPSVKQYRTLREVHRNRGDLEAMLNLVAQPQQFPPETVETHPVLQISSGLLAEPDPHAPLLLLGDSFTNVYSLGSLSWGQHAGLAEHLMYELNRPLDVIALNGEGAAGTRMELIRAARTGRLSEKKVLIYEFAIRDLASGNWKRVRMPQPPVVHPTGQMITQHYTAPSAKSPRLVAPLVSTPAGGLSSQRKTDESEPSVSRTLGKQQPLSSPTAAPKAVDGGLEVVAKIVAVSTVPEPGTAPYKDCITIVKFMVSSIERGHLDDQSILVAFWGMQNNVWADAAQYKPGDVLRMALIPFEKADDAVRGTQRADNVQDYDSPLFWATRVVVTSK